MSAGIALYISNDFELTVEGFVYTMIDVLIGIAAALLQRRYLSVHPVKVSFGGLPSILHPSILPLPLPCSAPRRTSPPRPTHRKSRHAPHPSHPASPHWMAPTPYRLLALPQLRCSSCRIRSGCFPISLCTSQPKST